MNRETAHKIISYEGRRKKRVCYSVLVRLKLEGHPFCKTFDYKQDAEDYINMCYKLGAFPSDEIEEIPLICETGLLV